MIKADLALQAGSLCVGLFVVRGKAFNHPLPGVASLLREWGFHFM